MKKTWLILIITFLPSFFLVSNAQPKVGFKAGLNSSHLSGFNGSNRLSLHTGFFVQYTITSEWHFQPELLYSGEGQQYSQDEIERNLSLSYIQLPLMIQYFLLQKFYVECGPQFAVLTRAIDKGSDNDKLNVKRSLRNFQFGMGFGLGVNVHKCIGFYGRYDLGLTDITLFGNSIDRSRIGQLGMTLRFK